MGLHIKKGSKPFKDMEWAFTSPGARRELMPIIGTFLERDAKAGAREKIGGNFGQEVANTVSYRFSAGRSTKLTVGSSHFAASHKQTGGTITAPGKGPGAKGAQALTIPISEVARGKSARQFNNTFLLVRPGKNTIIMQTVGDHDARPLFVLAKSVTQKGVHWFPTDKDAVRVARKSIRLWLSRRRSR